MGHNIPVFYIPMERSKVPDTLDKWTQLSDVLNEAYRDPMASGLRQATSKGWWFQGVLDGLTRYWGVAGLGFIWAEAACLSPEEVDRAESGLREMLLRLRDPANRPQRWEESLRAIFWLWYERDDREWTARPSEILHRAMSESEAGIAVVSEVEHGYQQLFDFMCFLKTTLAALEAARERGVSLLYIRPQP